MADCHLVFDEDLRIEGLTTSEHDITARKRSENNLRKRNEVRERRVSEIAAEASH
jgi:hypothetical protein